MYDDGLDVRHEHTSVHLYNPLPAGGVILSKLLQCLRLFEFRQRTKRKEKKPRKLCNESFIMKY